MKLKYKMVLHTASVWIICAAATEFFPKWGFQFLSGLLTGIIWYGRTPADTTEGGK